MSQLRRLYVFEKDRRESFPDWPFDEKSSCSVSKMAEAGFFWSGNERDPDTVTCFVCRKTLQSWEDSDNPWKEHEKHAPQCMFIKYRRPENELLVEEFLNLFGATLKSNYRVILDEKKKKLAQLAQTEMDAFIKGKK